jgi:hypothetical protein
LICEFDISHNGFVATLLLIYVDEMILKYTYNKIIHQQKGLKIILFFCQSTYYCHTTNIKKVVHLLLDLLCNNKTSILYLLPRNIKEPRVYLYDVEWQSQIIVANLSNSLFAAIAHKVEKKKYENAL